MCAVIAVYVASSGCGLVGGGISRARSFRNTFSHSCGFDPMRSVSALSSIRPETFSRSLWQVMQYLSSTARGDVCARREGTDHKRHKKDTKSTNFVPLVFCLVPFVVGSRFCLI